jgi:hypothetical protein
MATAISVSEMMGISYRACMPELTLLREGDIPPTSSILWFAVLDGDAVRWPESWEGVSSCALCWLRFSIQRGEQFTGS